MSLAVTQEFRPKERLGVVLRAHAFLEAVLDNSADCIKVIEASGRISFMSAAGLRLLGVERLEDAAETCWLLYWEHPARAREALDRALAGEAVLFEGACPRPDGTSGWWEVQLTPMRDAGQPTGQVVAISRDISEKRAAQVRQRLLINELNHRVKNSLATIQSVAAQTFRNATSLDEAQRNLESRLLALSRVHNVLTRESWEGADLVEVVAQGLEPYCDGRPDGFVVEGASLRLEPRQALALSMALQELTTNALKHGALSAPDGHVRIAWSLLPSQGFTLRWEERGGPVVTPPSRRGFGSRLLQGGLAHELGAKVDLRFDPEGVSCTIVTPGAA